MKVIKVEWQHRNDYEAIAECEFCGHKQMLRNGYFDYTFAEKVIPAIKCINCDRRTNEVVPEEISDPGYQGAVHGEVPQVSLKEQVVQYMSNAFAQQGINSCWNMTVDEFISFLAEDVIRIVKGDE